MLRLVQHGRKYTVITGRATGRGKYRWGVGSGAALAFVMLYLSMEVLSRLHGSSLGVAAAVFAASFG
jgi:hypothetical protein